MSYWIYIGAFGVFLLGYICGYLSGRKTGLTEGISLKNQERATELWTELLKGGRDVGHKKV